MSSSRKYNREMSRRTRSSSSSTASPPPTLDLTRRPISLRNNDRFESSPMASLYESPSSSPVGQESRTHLSEPRNSLSRVSVDTSNAIGSRATFSNNVSETPVAPSPIRSTSSTDAFLVSSSASSFASSLISGDKNNKYGFHKNQVLSQKMNTWGTSNKDDDLNEYASYRSGAKPEIVAAEEEEEEEEKVIALIRSSKGSTDGSCVRNNSYTMGRSVRTRNRKFLTCEPSTISSSSATTDRYYNSSSTLNSPEEKADAKEAKSTEGKRYFHDFFSRIWRRKLEVKPDNRKEAKFAEFYEILRKKEDSIDARLLEESNLARNAMRETERKLESKRLKATAKMEKKIASAEKKAQDSKAKERQSTDKKISKVVCKRSWWKSLFNR